MRIVSPLLLRNGCAQLLAVVMLLAESVTAQALSQEAADSDDYIITVKILVDEDEPAAAHRWSERLRSRVEQASQVFEANYAIRFKVVAEGRWQSDNTADSFDEVLNDFETKVSAKPARLAIGFSSQRLVGGPLRLGGTRGPLASHLLINEASRLTSERARIEVLVHELGHFLGAVHSPDPTSVMRTPLGDGRVNARAFQIAFDPVNTLIVYSVAQELKSGRVDRMSDLSAETRALLREVYTDMSRATPGDETVSAYARLLAGGGSIDSAKEASSPLVKAARIAVAAVTKAAKENVAASSAGNGAANESLLSRDALTESYVRRAAQAVAKSDTNSVRGLLLGLGVAFDDSNLLRRNPMTRRLWTAVESNEERAERLRVLGPATISGRKDLAQHFFVSAAIAACYGKLLAEAAGVHKELADAQGGSGFSFADLLADFAGVAFAREMLADPDAVTKLADSFRVADYLPDTSGLPEGLSHQQFEAKFGSILDPRFTQQTARLRRAIDDLHRQRKLRAK